MASNKETKEQEDMSKNDEPSNVEDSILSSVESEGVNYVFDVETANQKLFDSDFEYSNLESTDDPSTLSEAYQDEPGRKSSAVPRLTRMSSLEELSQGFSRAKSKSFDFDSVKELKIDEKQRLRNENKTLREGLTEAKQTDEARLNDIKSLQETVDQKQIKINELNEQNQQLWQQLGDISVGSDKEVLMDQSRVIADLKIELEQKDKDIERLKSVESSFIQTKQVLKDTSWTLRVKELELKNIKSDMRENYEKRLNELQIRLNDRDLKIQSMQNENNACIERENDHILRIDELSQQIHLLKDELELKSDEFHQMQYQMSLTEMEKEKVEKTSTENIDLLTKQLMELREKLHQLEQPAESSIIPTNTDNTDSESHLLKQIETLKKDKSNLQELLQEKDNMYVELEESTEKEIKKLQSDIAKGNCHINELVLLLEGASTNSDNLPTKKVQDAINEPLQPHFIRRKSSSNGSKIEKSEVDSKKEFFHDSFDEIEDLEQENDFSEGAESLKFQMAHTIEHYENQIKELQALYDQDIFALEREKKELLQKVNEMKIKCEEAENSRSISNLNNDQLKSHYEEQLKNMEEKFNKIIEQEKQHSKSICESLENENEKMKLILCELEERFAEQLQNTEKEIQNKYKEHYEDGLSDIFAKQHDAMLLIQEELRKELEDIHFTHKNEINSLKDETEKEQSKANELEDTFSKHILNMNEKQTDMQTEIHNLQAELKHLQVEYDSLKNRYGVLVQTNDVTSGQNTDLKNDLETHSDQIDVLNMKIIAMATEISKKDQEIDFLKNQNNKEKDDLENGSQQNRLSEDLQETGSALHEEIKTLRKNLDEAKNEVKELHKEKENYSSLSDALSNELQALKEELENQHSFAVLGNTTLSAQEKTIDEMQELEIENKSLKEENKLLQKQIKGRKDKVPNFSSEDMIQEVVLQPMAIESMETMPVGNSSHIEREKKMYIDELKEKENHINDLEIQIKQLSEELTSWKDAGDIEETSKIIQDLRDQLATKEQVGQHLQEVFSRQLEQAQNQNKELLVQMDNLKSLHKDANKAIHEKEREVEDLQNEVSKLNEKMQQIDELQTSLRQERERNNKNASLIESLKETISVNDSHIESLQTEGKRLQEDSMSKENLRKAELEEYYNTKKKMEECLKEKEKSLVHLHEEFEEYKNKIIKNNNCMKEEYESNLNLLKENLEGYNEESLHKLREDLDREHAERLQAVEDKLHEEYANRMRNIKDQHKEEIKVLEAQRDKDLYNQKTTLEAEHKKVVGTVKLAMERTHSNEIKELHDSYEKEIDTVKCALQMERESELQHLTSQLSDAHEKKLGELESTLSSSHQLQLEEVRSNLCKEQEESITKVTVKLKEELKKEKEDEMIKMRNYYVDLLEKTNIEHEQHLNKEIKSLKNNHEEELNSLKQYYEEELKKLHSQYNSYMEKRKLEEEESKEAAKLMVEKSVTEHLTDKFEIEKDQIKEAHSNEVLRVVSELKDESNNYLNEIVKELEDKHSTELEHLNNLQTLKLNQISVEHEDCKNEIVNEFERKISEIESDYESKIENLEHQNSTLKADISKKENFLQQKLQEHSGRIKEECEKNSKLDISHIREIYEDKLQEKDKKCDQELQKLQETYEDKISKLYEDFHRSTMDREAEVMKSYELVEERRTTEEKLHAKIQDMESSHLIEFEKLKNEYETRMVNEKVKLEKLMNEDFQVKLTSINSRHDTILNNLKEEHIGSLEDLANRNLKEIAVLHTKLVLAESCQIKLQEDYERNITDISDKLHDVTSKYTELQSFHNEVIEKYDRSKEDFEKKLSVLTLEKEELVNTLNENKESYESQIEMLSSQIQILNNDDQQVISLADSDQDSIEEAAENYVVLALKNSVQELAVEEDSLLPSYMLAPSKHQLNQSDILSSPSKNILDDSRTSTARGNVFKISHETETIVEQNIVIDLIDKDTQTEYTNSLELTITAPSDDEDEKIRMEEIMDENEILKEKLWHLEENIKNQKDQFLNEIGNLTKLNEELEKELDLQINDINGNEALQSEIHNLQRDIDDLLLDKVQSEKYNKELLSNQSALTEELQTLKNNMDVVKLNHMSEMNKLIEEMTLDTKQKLRLLADDKQNEFDTAKMGLMKQHQTLIDEFVAEQERKLDEMKKGHVDELGKLKEEYVTRQTDDLNELQNEFQARLNEAIQNPVIDPENPIVRSLVDEEVGKQKEKLNEDHQIMCEKVQKEYDDKLENACDLLKESLEKEHIEKLKDIEKYLQEEHQEQLHNLKKINEKHIVDMEELKSNKDNEIKQIKNEHTEELEALKQHYEQVKLEVIGAVNSDVEEEMEKMKEQLTSAHQLELENLKSQTDIANSRVQTNENIKEGIKKNYEEAISKMREDYSEQIKQLHELYKTDTGRRKGQVTSDSGVQTYIEEFPENVSRISGSLTEFAVVNIKEPDIVVDSKELLTSSRLPSKTDKDIVSEETAIYEPAVIVSNQAEVPLQSGVDCLLQEKPKENFSNKADDEPYKILEKALSEVKEENDRLHQELGEVVQEKEQLKNNLSAASSHTEMLLERHEREEQESSNLVNILRDDISQLNTQRDDLQLRSDSLHDSLKNVVSTMTSIEDVIHEKLDQLIMVHAGNLTQNTLSVLDEANEDAGNNNNQADSKHNHKNEVPDDTLVSQQIDDDLADINKTGIDPDNIHFEFTPGNAVKNGESKERDVSEIPMKNKCNVDDSKQVHAIGVRVQVSVEHLLEILQVTIAELQENQHAYEELSNKTRAQQTEHQKIQKLNQENLEKINLLTLENEYFSKELGEANVRLKDGKKSLTVLNQEKEKYEEENNVMMQEKEELMQKVVGLDEELNSINNEMIEARQKLADVNTKVQTEKEKIDKECTNLKNLVNEYQTAVEDLTNKNEELMAERDLLVRDKREKEMKLAELKTELDNERYVRKQNEIEVPRKISKSTFENDEEIDKLQQEVLHLSRIIDEMTEEKEDLRSQLLDSGYSAREDSINIKKDLYKALDEKELLEKQVQELETQVGELNEALTETLQQKNALEEVNKTLIAPKDSCNIEKDLREALSDNKILEQQVQELETQAGELNKALSETLQQKDTLEQENNILVAQIEKIGKPLQADITPVKNFVANDLMTVDRRSTNDEIAVTEHQLQGIQHEVTRMRPSSSGIGTSVIPNEISEDLVEVFVPAAQNNLDNDEANEELVNIKLEMLSKIDLGEISIPHEINEGESTEEIVRNIYSKPLDISELETDEHEQKLKVLLKQMRKLKQAGGEKMLPIKIADEAPLSDVINLIEAEINDLENVLETKQSSLQDALQNKQVTEKQAEELRDQLQKIKAFEIQMNDQNENLKKYNEEILADLTKVKEDDKTLKENNENLLTKLKEHQQQSDDLLLQQKQSQIKINELKDLNNIINEQNSELKNHIDLLKGQINVLRENENSNMKHFKQNEDHTIGLKDQIEELKEALSTSQIESQESLSALKKQLTEEQEKYSTIRRQLFKTEEEYSKKIITSHHLLEAKEKETNALLLQTEQLQQHIEEINSTHNEQLIQDNSNEIAEQKAYMEQLEKDLEEKEIALAQKNNELIELKQQILQMSQQRELRERGDGVNQEELASELQNAYKKINELISDVSLKNKEVEELARRLDELAKNDVGNGSFIPQSEMVKILLSDLQKEADEVLDLVLNYPESNEPQDIENLQNTWSKEKETLLGVIKSLKDFITTLTAQQFNTTNLLNEENLGQLPRNLNDSQTSNIHDQRQDLIKLVKDIFDKEQDALIAEINTLSEYRNGRLPVNEDMLQKQREFFNSLIKELESKDRNQLLEEISHLRRGMDSLNKNIGNLTHDLNAKESINDKNQDTILKLYQAIDQEKGDKLNLQKGLEAERKRQSELSRKLSEANERIEELENEAANDRNDLIDGEQIKEELKDQNEKHQDVILKLYKLVDEEKNQRKQAENELVSEKQSKSSLTQELAETNKMVETLQGMVEKERKTLMDKLKEKENLANSKQNEDQQVIMRLYQLVDSEQNKRIELQKQLQENNTRNLQLEKILSEHEKEKTELQDLLHQEKLAANENSLTQHDDILELQNLLKEEAKKCELVEKQIRKKENENKLLLDDVTREKEKLKNILAREQRLKQKIEEILHLLETERNKKIEMERALEDANDKLRTERQKVDDMNNMILEHNSKLKLREKKLDKLMNDLEYESEKLKERQESQDSVEKMINDKKHEIEEMEYQLKQEKRKCEEENKKFGELGNLMSKIDKLEFEKTNLKSALKASNESVDKLEKKLEAMKELKSEKVRVENALENVEDKYQEMRIKCDYLSRIEEEKTKLANSLVKSKSQLDELKRQLKEKQKRNDLLEKSKTDIEIKQNDIIKNLKEKLQERPSAEISEDGKKLLNAGWTIAKVQRLYLKYFRAESFRKALAYQKRYLLLLLSEHQQTDESVLAFVAKLKSPSLVVEYRKPHSIPKRRFKVAVHAVTAINRLKYLTRKYQRNLFKSSPEYMYKDKPHSTSVKQQSTATNTSSKLPVLSEEDVIVSRENGSHNLEQGKPEKPWEINGIVYSLPSKDYINSEFMSDEASSQGKNSCSLSNLEDKYSNASSPTNELVRELKYNITQRNINRDSDERKPVYSPPTRLSGTTTLRQPPSRQIGRSPPRAYPRPKNGSFDRSSSSRSFSPIPNRDLATKRDVTVKLEDSSNSLNNYITKLENLQEKLKEQSKNVGKRRPSLL